MKPIDRVFNIELKGYDAPSFTINRNGRYVEYGQENSYPIYLVDLFNNSSTHNAIITAKINYIKGRGLTVNSNYSTEVIASLQNFINHPNPYETWQEIADRIISDYEIFNGFALEIIRSKSGKLAEVYHMPFSNLREYADDKKVLLYSTEWVDKDKSENYVYVKKMRPAITTLEKFEQDKNQPRSIYYYKEYRPDMDVYPLPDYVGALQAIRTEIEISNFDLNTIVNGFAGGTLINLYNGVILDDDQRADLEAKLKSKFTGSDNGNRIVVNFSDSKDAGGAEVIPLMGNDLPNRFEQLDKRVKEAIFVGHKVTSPMLLGVKTEGQLGSRNEILEAYEIFKETYIQLRQRKIIEAINDIFELKQLPRAIAIEELRPIQRELKIPDDILIKAIGSKGVIDYINSYYGLNIKDEVNINDSQSAQGQTLASQKVTFQEELVNNYLKSKGVSASNYDILSEFDIHYTEDGDVKFEINEFDVDFADPKDKVMAEIARIIRDNPKITQAQIAQALKIEVSAVRENINALKSGKMIDGTEGVYSVLPSGLAIIRKLPDQNTVILVKYKYGLRLDKLNESPIIAGTREFCRDMIQENRLYSKEEIEGMRNDMTSSFIPDIRDVWKYRGGWSRNKGSDVSVPFCRHIWRQVLVTERKK